MVQNGQIKKKTNVSILGAHNLGIQIKRIIFNFHAMLKIWKEHLEVTFIILDYIKR